MTTPTTENTVFLVTDVAVERCEEGREIRKRWAEAVRVATIETWWDVEGRGWLEYVRHYVKCAQCQEFELSKRGERWAVIEQQEAK